jgi:hypothetical protein
MANTGYASDEKKDLGLGTTRSASDDNMVGHAGIPDEVPSKITTRCLLLMMTICAGGFLFGYDIGE